LKANEDLDLDGAEKLTEWLIEKGVHGVFPVSNVGEASKLSMEEKKSLIKAIVDAANGRVPVVAGVGFPEARRTIELTTYAMDVGADAGLIMQPYGCFKPSDEALYNYYSTVNDAVDEFPLILYNIPATSGYELSPELVARCADLSNIVAIKDSGGDIKKHEYMLKFAGDRIKIFQGVDVLFFPSLSVGAAGGFLGGANFAADIEVGLYNSFVGGDMKKAIELHHKIVTFFNGIIEIGKLVASIKCAASMVSVPVGLERKPSETLTRNEVQRIRNALEEVGLLVAC
ncbi:MAG: dihydrodipicolinate synthase family protein, partial [Candidatus Bathyarchaeota archaeon]|nr:dihydrodipicolinate synthase family protein [Candidatus Bathyarchaeota archaeon]